MNPPTHNPWNDVSAARLPAESLAALAPVRNREGVRVVPAGALACVHWSAGRSDVVRCLLPVPGVVFFTRHAGLWFRFGSRVPSDDSPPDDDGKPVATFLVPARFEPLQPEPAAWSPVVLSVTRGGRPKPATALVCAFGDLVAWADRATTAELAAVRAVYCGDRTVLLGTKLPSIPCALRFWGETVLVPIGFRPEPDLPTTALREAVGVGDGELLLLDETNTEVIPRAVFEPLTRAGVRLGARGV